MGLIAVGLIQIDKRNSIQSLLGCDCALFAFILFYIAGNNRGILRVCELYSRRLGDWFVSRNNMYVVIPDQLPEQLEA